MKIFIPISLLPKHFRRRRRANLGEDGHAPFRPSGTRFPVEISQLYITAVVVEGMDIKTRPAIYLWNQPQDE